MSVPNNVPRTVGLSPKFTNVTAVTTLVGVALAVITWVQGNIELLGLNPVLSGLLLAILIPVAAGVTAYASPPGDVVGGTGPIAPGASTDDLTGI